MATLEEQVMAQMKDAMKSKNEGLLRGLRAIKAEIIKAKTDPGAGGSITAEVELKLLQKLVKQRKDSLAIFQEQNRADLAQKESEEIIATVGATGPQDLGKVMGVASKQLAGQADGKAVAAAVKAALG
jgi:uncharacterized protein YqeY